MTVIYQRTEFDSAHRLLGYDGNCSNLHGHRFLVEIWIDGGRTGALDKCGMLVDYRSIKGYFKDNFDHKTILNQDDPLVSVLKDNGVKVYTMEGNPTAENLARKILKDLNADKVRVHESADNFAEEVA